LGMLNSAYLTLLPKKVDALSARDFRPISLIHSFAKLVTKMLAIRLGPYLQELVASNQSAFVRGRSIHDNFMLVQHSIKSLHKKRVSSLLLKLDISKAFDSVSWAFLFEVLSYLGFGPVWRNMISNVGAKAKTPPFARGLRRTRCINGDKTTGRLTLRLIRRRTNTCDKVVSSCDLVQNGGPRAIRPIVTGPAWPLRITGLICKGVPVITVCNPALWEYSGDNLGV
jgi:hypothetical protein